MFVKQNNLYLSPTLQDSTERLRCIVMSSLSLGFSLSIKKLNTKEVLTNFNYINYIEL